MRISLKRKSPQCSKKDTLYWMNPNFKHFRLSLKGTNVFESTKLVRSLAVKTRRAGALSMFVFDNERLKPKYSYQILPALVRKKDILDHLKGIR